MFGEFEKILAETFDLMIKANKAMANMDANKFLEELKTCDGMVLEKLKKFG